MNLWRKLRETATFKAVGVFLAALLFGLSAAAVRRQKALADSTAQRSEQNAATGARRNVEKAAKLTEKSEKHKRKAEQARTAAEARLDQIGASDEELAILVNNWNAGRLRDD